MSRLLYEKSLLKNGPTAVEARVGPITKQNNKKNVRVCVRRFTSEKFCYFLPASRTNINLKVASGLIATATYRCRNNCQSSIVINNIINLF